MTRGLRNGARYRAVRARCLAEGEYNQTPCFHCGLPIDYEFTRQYPRHRLAGTAHHITELCFGGDVFDPANLAPSHFGCNSGEGNRVRAKLGRRGRLMRTIPALVPSSRRW